MALRRPLERSDGVCVSPWISKLVAWPHKRDMKHLLSWKTPIEGVRGMAALCILATFNLLYWMDQGGLCNDPV
jgi:hypothetical protein